MNVQFPSGAAPVGGWPTIIQIDGYGGASDPMNADSETFGNGNYVTVHMSLRGTACSGGQFDLFDRRSSEDGNQVIEWIADQEWSNGKVAIWGHSYSGLTGWLVASTQPEHLVAMSVSGLIDDLYRGIVYMGGVSNFGFPLIWTAPIVPLPSTRAERSPACRPVTPPACPTSSGAFRPTLRTTPSSTACSSLGEDGQWWKSHSTITYIDAINIPTHIVQSYQDEQTGPRGSNLLWQRLDELKPDLPKRLLLTNGVHSTNTSPPQIRDDRIAFLDCYVRGVCSGDILDQSKRVKVFFEMHDVEGSLEPNGVLADANWPLDVTQWTRYYFGTGNALGPTPPGANEAADPYVAGSKRAGAWVYYATNVGAELTTADLPDEVRYQTEPFAQDVGIAGPIDVSLFASSLAVDTEFYVEVNDVDADGNMTRLQRGMLKASHRELDPRPDRLHARRRDLPSVQPAHQHAVEPHHARRDLQVRDRGLPARSRFPRRAPAAATDHDSSDRRLDRVLHPDDTAGRQPDLPRRRAPVLDPAADRAVAGARGRRSAAASRSDWSGATPGRNGRRNGRSALRRAAGVATVPASCPAACDL